MLRVLLLVVLAVVVLWWLMGRARRDDPPRTGRGADAAAKKTTRSARSPALPAEIVSCAHCGLHLPRPEAVVDEAGRLYCDEEHRRAGPD
jgi:uncharacterized protein